MARSRVVLNASVTTPANVDDSDCSGRDNRGRRRGGGLAGDNPAAPPLGRIETFTFRGGGAVADELARTVRAFRDLIAWDNTRLADLERQVRREREAKADQPAAS